MVVKEISLLRKAIEQFSSIPDEDWDLLFPHIVLKSLKKHEYFSQEGKRSNEVGFIISGLFRQYYTVDG